jgi:hypothetical protein
LVQPQATAPILDSTALNPGYAPAGDYSATGEQLAKQAVRMNTEVRNVKE